MMIIDRRHPMCHPFLPIIPFLSLLTLAFDPHRKSDRYIRVMVVDRLVIIVGDPLSPITPLHTSTIPHHRTRITLHTILPPHCHLMGKTMGLFETLLQNHRGPTIWTMAMARFSNQNHYRQKPKTGNGWTWTGYSKSSPTILGWKRCVCRWIFWVENTDYYRHQKPTPPPDDLWKKTSNLRKAELVHKFAQWNNARIAICMQLASHAKISHL